MPIAELQAPPEVLTALRDGRRNGQWIRARCPYCDPAGRKGRSLVASHQGFGRRKDRPGWKCHRCQADHKTASAGEALKIRYDPSDAKADEKRRLQYAISLIERSRSVDPGDVVDRYLRGRKLEPPFGSLAWPASLRRTKLVHPSDRRKPRGQQRQWPVMLAIVTNVANMPVGVHRTYLSDSGTKAPVDPVKLTLGPIAGGAIRLGIESPKVILAEGIETAIGAHHVYPDFVPWALMSTGHMESFQLPRHVDDVLIAVDNDRNGAGLRASKKLLARIKNFRITQKRYIRADLVHPPDGRSDFADL